MKIKDEQLQVLLTYKCERLSTNAENKKLIQGFKSQRGKSLVNYLKKKAWQEDSNGELAFYIIKNADGKPCLFFSLKCGAMYEPFDEKGIQEYIEAVQEIKDGIQKPEDIVSKALELEIQPAELYFILTSIFPRKMKKMSLKKKDEKDDANESIVRVNRNLPGIELVHFCSDDVEKEKWDKDAMQHSMGETLFWFYIVPKIEETLKLVGCQYVFLFAADSTIDGSLMNYYDVTLKFFSEKKYGTSKPVYDFGCFFMHQKVEELLANRDAFFEAFNEDDSEIII